MIQQNIFDFTIKENYGNDDFFVSNSNLLAHKIMFNRNNQEKYIYLKGPPKSGKTHIGQLWQKINNAILFNYNDYNMILGQKKNVFVDNFSLNFDEEKLFHLINHCYSNNLNILVTSELSSTEQKFKLSDLSSRLKTFYFAEIFNPDDELLNNLLIKLMHDRQIHINNDEIFSFITKRIARTYLAIYNFVDTIDKLSLSKKKKITIPLIKELL